MTNKELLICIDVKLKALKEQFDNHLAHHGVLSNRFFLVTLASISATLTVIGTLVVFIFTK